MTPVAAADLHDLRLAATDLLRPLGVTEPPRLLRIPGGANNRVYRLRAGAQQWLLKSYYQSADDPRDRFATEWAFADYLWSGGVRAVAQPIACDAARRLGLFAFIQGDRPRRGGVASPDVAQARRFVRQSNRQRRTPAAQALRTASEACFTIDEHLSCVERRLTRLAQSLELSPRDGADRAARHLILAGLLPRWQEVCESVYRQCAQSSLDCQAPVPPDDRVLSPSDFGFHNAIRGGDGRLRFFDFEYAGWDDPAKLVCDFFCQPAVPAPPRFFDAFARTVTALTEQPALHRRRIELLLPVYRCKWVCIALNEFTPGAAERRRFALGRDIGVRKARQLVQARRLLAAMRAEPAGAAV